MNQQSNEVEYPSRREMAPGMVRAVALAIALGVAVWFWIAADAAPVLRVVSTVFGAAAGMVIGVMWLGISIQRWQVRHGVRKAADRRRRRRGDRDGS